MEKSKQGKEKFEWMLPRVRSYVVFFSSPRHQHQKRDLRRCNATFTWKRAREIEEERERATEGVSEVYRKINNHSAPAPRTRTHFSPSSLIPSLYPALLLLFLAHSLSLDDFLLLFFLFSHSQGVVQFNLTLTAISGITQQHDIQ